MLFYEKVKPQIPKSVLASEKMVVEGCIKPECAEKEPAESQEKEREPVEAKDNRADCEVKTDHFSLDNSNAVNSKHKCDIEDKDSLLTLDSNVKPENESLKESEIEVMKEEKKVDKKIDQTEEIASTSKVVSPSKERRITLLSKDLEEWIWQDNKQFLQDRNIFEHTYFK